MRDHAAYRPPAAAPLLLADLFQSTEELTPLLAAQVAAGSWLDAYLIAAAINQIAEDYLHRSPLLTAKLRGLLPLVPGLPSLAAARLGTIEGRLRDALMAAPGNRAALDWQRRVAAAVGHLAALVTGGGTSEDEALARRTADRLLAACPGLPRALAVDPLRVPSCFRSFDQRPEDLRALAERFAERWPERRPLVVAGVRTSGSYLAPLLAGYLARLGYPVRSCVTVRPSGGLLAPEIAVLREAARQALLLLCDDPPATGGTLAAAARRLQGAGFTPDRTVLLYAEFAGSGECPPLRQYARVTLPWSEWSVHRSLEPEAVKTALQRLLAPKTEVLEVCRSNVCAPSGRGHVKARYQIRVAGPGIEEGGDDREVLVKGCGLGLFGNQVLAVGGKMAEFVPDVYGVTDGLLLREWLLDGSQLDWARESSAPAEVARYVAERSRRLGLPADVSLRMSGRDVVWELAATLLQRGFGCAAPIAGWPCRVAARRLMRVRSPAVIDGANEPDRWFASRPGKAQALKVSFADGPFSNLDEACCDPVFDVAVLAAHSDENMAQALRSAYVKSSGCAVDAERWFLYQLVHLLRELERLQRREQETSHVTAALGRVHRCYMRERLLAGLHAGATGPVVAIDVDGVLEKSRLGASATTPAGAMTLRALLLHGYRPVLASGRCLDDIRDRCRAYGLWGGAAEYGATLYRASTGEMVDLLDPRQREHMDAVRQAVATMEGVCLDRRYHGIVRAYQPAPRRQRRALPGPVADAALAKAGLDRAAVQVIKGQAQTDFVPAGIDKGLGLRALIGQSEIALAVGDSVSDLPMLALARLAYATGNASRAVTAGGVRRTRQPFQAGLAEAAAALLGHPPGRCAVCRPPRMPKSARLLLTALAAQDTQGAGSVMHLVRLMAALGPA
ncbi:MAG TPA: HAD hydrolase family protein [Chloroflexota bacterium]|nr:HAD hydrolase family protein [Chloroflexota bacterium]